MPGEKQALLEAVNRAALAFQTRFRVLLEAVENVAQFGKPSRSKAVC
jgi:hypothetical protein